MLKNPSREQLEDFRLTGRSGGYLAKWGYHPTAGERIFYLEKNEQLPGGWFDTPAKFPVTNTVNTYRDQAK